MIKIICDKCGKDCGRVARDIQVFNLVNPVPQSINDVGTPKITEASERKRFILCKDCYQEMGLPNIYDDGLVFRDKEKPL